MILLTCPECGEEYPPQVTDWVCPICSIDGGFKRMVVYDLIEDEKE